LHSDCSLPWSRRFVLESRNEEIYERIRWWNFILCPLHWNRQWLRLQLDHGF